MKRYKMSNALLRNGRIARLFGLSLLLWTSCKTLQPHEQVHINDPEMQLGLDATGDFQNYIYKIREGATPSGTSKTSGGCGCN